MFNIFARKKARKRVEVPLFEVIVVKVKPDSPLAKFGKKNDMLKSTKKRES